MRVKLTLGYDGTFFSGFQKQNGLKTIQGELETALKNLYGEDISVCGSGRTDAGVHALGQAVHYDCEKEISSERIAGALNYYLPDSIRVISASYAEKDFDARKSAHKKTYFYDMYFGDVENPVLKDRAYFAGKKPNVKAMKAAAELFEGTHDFRAFRCEGSSAKTTVRTVFDCSPKELELYGCPAVRITVSADGFLYKMVRIICGFVLRAGQGKISTEKISELLGNPSEDFPKIPLPPQGLYLKTVEY